MHIPRQETPSATTILCLPPACRILSSNNSSTTIIKGIITTKRHRHLGHAMKMAQVSANNNTVAPSAGPFRCTRRKQANPRRKNGECSFISFLCLVFSFVFVTAIMYFWCHLHTPSSPLSLKLLTFYQLTGNESHRECSTSCISSFSPHLFLSVSCGHLSTIGGKL